MKKYILPTCFLSSALLIGSFFYKSIIPYTGFHDLNSNGRKEFVYVVKNKDVLFPWSDSRYSLRVKSGFFKRPFFGEFTYDFLFRPKDISFTKREGETLKDLEYMANDFVDNKRVVPNVYSYKSRFLTEFYEQ